MTGTVINNTPPNFDIIKKFAVLKKTEKPGEEPDTLIAMGCEFDRKYSAVAFLSPGQQGKLKTVAWSQYQTDADGILDKLYESFGYPDDSLYLVKERLDVTANE